MKSIGKIILVTLSISLLFLLYVHGQISLLQISYRLDEKSDLLSEKAEYYRYLKFEVDQLKAPRLLEEKIKEFSYELTLPKEVKVIRVAPGSGKSASEMNNVSGASLSEGLLQVLGKLVGVAQAKTES